MRLFEAKKNALTELNGISGEAEAEVRFMFDSCFGRHAPDRELTADEGLKIDGMLRRRRQGEPLQYILGEWEFMGLPFATDSRALIPRQDTETLCEAALEILRKRRYVRCLDMCCGSGCIGISLAKLYGGEWTFSDISEAALSLAAENAEKNEVAGKFVRSDLFDGIRGSFEFIAVNPPYLSGKDMEMLQRELEFEPKNALFGGDDGLEFYRRIAAEAKLHCVGDMLLEVGAGQAETVAAMFDRTDIIKDLTGTERVIWVKFGE